MPEEPDVDLVVFNPDNPTSVGMARDFLTDKVRRGYVIISSVATSEVVTVILQRGVAKPIKPKKSLSS